jgi:hypothetical protein
MIGTGGFLKCQPSNRTGDVAQEISLHRMELSIAKIPSALKPLTLASPAGRLPNHDGRTGFVVFVSEIRA